MNILFTTFTAVGTLFIIGMLGFWLLSRHILISNVLGPLSVLAIDIALPCLIFANILTNFHPGVCHLRTKSQAQRLFSSMGVRDLRHKEKTKTRA